ACSHSQPRSMGKPCPLSRVQARPPTRSRASSTTKRQPAAASARPAPTPAAPAPITTTSKSAPALMGACETLRPGLADLARLLESGDLVGRLQGEADVVEPVHQAVLAEGIDVEVDGAAIRPGDLLLLEIDGDDGVGATRGVVHQEIDLL